MQNTKIFSRNAKILWKPWVLLLQQLIAQKNSGILCSDSSIFEVLLCHINNFSSVTLINVWWREFDFTSYLLKFLSARALYICSTVIMSQPITRKNLLMDQSQHFTENFHIIFLGEIFALFFLRNFRIVFFCKIFRIFSPFLFRENFAFFREQVKCKN